ncbi:transporter substrate-binding domain-containing protein [Streptomyces sp. ACA25]|uniref:transporter substrate-binding domain-containing protein n=1 Tax=Streptomyces sp. ACA25 TaxID=3022596 RepID=UPI0023076FBF|nr:transporter substrate-binding domain-containing protein [Streptomyces sp. ACA25]MDB1087131.1 transporter substrate-binding domain-containing protein [Streptomyces sp. ACA25]
MTRRAVTALAGCLTAALAATACGGSPEAAEAADDDAAGYPLVEDGKLTFAMSGQYRPFNYFDESGEIAGFDVDLGAEIAERLGLEPNPVTGPFNSLVAGLKSERYDLIIGSMSPTEERKKEVDFTDEYYVAGAQLFVSDDSSVTSVDELENASVGVVLGTTFEEFADEQAGISDVTTYTSDNEALRDLANGRTDAAITTNLLGLYQIKETGLTIKPVGEVLFPDPAAIASQQKNTALTAEVNEILAALRSDGTYTELSEKWFGVDISANDAS